MRRRRRPQGQARAACLRVDQLPLSVLFPDDFECIIAGSRKGVTQQDVDDAMRAAMARGMPRPDRIRSGGACGADTLGERWAELRDIPVERDPVTPGDWEEQGDVAGYRRNERMARSGAKACVVVRAPGVSNGSDGMIALAEQYGLWLHVHDVGLSARRR